MTRILALDTSTDACSVALMDGQSVREDFRIEPRRHTHLLLPMVDALLAESGIRVQDLDAIAFGRAPALLRVSVSRRVLRKVWLWPLTYP